MTFTIEEISLLLEMNHSNRNKALQELRDLLAITADEWMHSAAMTIPSMPVMPCAL